MESKNLLAANVLDSVTASLSNAGTERTVEMVVTAPAAPAGERIALQILVNNSSGSTFDPRAVTVRNAQGNPVAPTESLDDLNGLGSLTTMRLVPGTYELAVTGENNTTGSFSISVSLLGDIFNPVSTVNDFEALYATAANIQDSGLGNYVTATFFQSRGIDMSQSLFDTGLDANGNGRVDGNEAAFVQSNSLFGAVSVDLQSDVDPPVLTAQLQSDNGASQIDGITSDATIVGTITDESDVTIFEANLDGGAFRSVLGQIQNDTFTLTKTVLDSLAAGGTLTEGPHTVRLRATDELGNASNDVVVSFTFIPNNVAPTVATIPNQTATEDSAFTFNVGSSFTDPNTGDVLRFSSSNLPSWLTINATTGVLSGTPANANVGTANVTVRATDAFGLFVDGTVQITVNNVNDAPTVSIPNQTATVDVPFSVDLTDFIDDVDAGDTFDTLNVSVQLADGFNPDGSIINARPLPTWLTYNATTGILSGTPASGDAGTLGIGVIVADQTGATGNDLFQLEVLPGDPPPQLVTPVPDQNATVGQSFSANLGFFFEDPNNQALTFSIVESVNTNLPPWLTFNTTTGVLSGTPSSGDVGTITLMVTATDPAGGTASDTFNLTVSPAFDGTVQFTMQTLDRNGAAVTTIDQGATFTLVVSVEDVRANATGVFAAYLDVDFNGTFVSTNGVITHSSTYSAGTNGAVVDGTMASAQIDEVGGVVNGFTAIGPGVFEVFRIDFVAGNTAGVVTFSGNESENQSQRGVLVFGGTAPVPIADIDFGTTSIAIGGLTAPLSVSFSAPLNNPLNPYDVNGDSDVSPLDALLVINELSGHAAASGPIYVDVNADGDLSPLDALMVINQLNPSAARAPLSSGVIASDVDEEEGSFSLYDAIFADEFDV